MINLLYSIYTTGFPNKNVGGPNHIIYDIIKNHESDNYNIDYLSYDSFLPDLNNKNIQRINNPHLFKKKITNQLFENFNWYRQIVSNDYYLPIHLYKKQRRFNKFSKSVEKYNVIHSKDSLAISYLENIKNVKTIISVHSNGPLSNEITANIKNLKLMTSVKNKISNLEEKAINNADIITFPSFAAKEIFCNDINFEIEPDKIKIVYNGIDANYITNINDYDNILLKFGISKKYDLVLTNVSTYRKERRLDILFLILQKLKFDYHKNVLLINIGDGIQNKRLVSLVNKMGLQNNIKLLSGIPNDDVIRLMKISDAFIMTTERVIFDLVVLEALASGTTAFVSNDGGNKEVIIDGENGFLIDINNIDLVAKQIITYANNFKIKENAIKTANLFSVKKMVKNYFDLYENLLNGI